MTSPSAAAPPPAVPFGTRQVDSPRAGFFSIKLVKGGVRVPGRIIHDFDLFQAELDGVLQGPPHEDPFKANGVSRLWEYGREITADEFALMTRQKAIRPDPRKAVDLNKLPSIF